MIEVLKCAVEEGELLSSPRSQSVSTLDLHTCFHTGSNESSNHRLIWTLIAALSSALVEGTHVLSIALKSYVQHHTAPTPLSHMLSAPIPPIPFDVSPNQASSSLKQSPDWPPVPAQASHRIDRVSV